MQKGNIFNEEVKNKFLDSQSEDTAKIYASVFRKIGKHELFVGRDIYTFNLLQLEMLMERLEFKTDNVAKTYGRIISSYLNWSIEQGLRTDENPIRNIGNEWFEKFVSKIKLYINEEELINIENKLVNFQDKVIPRLIFEGVGGFQLSELTNLTINDISGNTLFLEDIKFGKRSLDVSETAIDYIVKANKETQYYNRNGNAIGKRTVSELVDNNYIIKSTVNRNMVNTNDADRHLIYRRISTLSELFNLPFLTPKGLEKSGMQKYAYELYKESGKLDNEELTKVAERFNIKKVMINGEYRYNYATLREFVNIENIKDLYFI